jgi:hypothetical protein
MNPALKPNATALGASISSRRSLPVAHTSHGMASASHIGSEKRAVFIQTPAA